MDAIVSEINHVIERDIKPLLHDHNGDIELISAIDGVVKVKFLGACKGCPGAQLTINDLVELKLKEQIPSVKKVILVNDIPEDMISLAKKLLSKEIS